MQDTITLSQTRLTPETPTQQTTTATTSPPFTTPTAGAITFPTFPGFQPGLVGGAGPIFPGIKGTSKPGKGLFTASQKKGFAQTAHKTWNARYTKTKPDAK